MPPDRDTLARRLAEAGLRLVADGADWIVEGDTFPSRDLIRACGGRWNGSRRRWTFRFDEAGARAGLAEAGAQPFAGQAAAGPARKHFLGHRERLRDRFREAGPAALADYELVELLLFFSVYRRDTKPIAKAMLARFGSLAGLLAADPAGYGECLGITPAGSDEAVDRATVRDDDQRFTGVLLKAIHELLQRVLKEQIRDRPVLGSWTALIDYLQLAMSHDPTEHFRILFLDRKNVLIRDEVQTRGTVDHTPLYPREVVKRALELGASALIMVHNHPSGDPTPSKADIEMTRQVVAALGAVDIALHDHVVVGRNRHTSFRSSRLL
ncbi:MAG: JAB domain-containing protein [Geminicoccaceae bacterium]